LGLDVHADDICEELDESVRRVASHYHVMELVRQIGPPRCELSTQ
jgi:hypothetical protein